MNALGGCDVLHQLKAGGMGEVLLARRRAAGGFEKLVAVKTIRKDLRAVPHLRTMFLDEARLLSGLDHPAIAQVHDFGEEGDTLYLVMEYVSGVRFTELIRRRPPPAICARAMAEVCRGLHAAHELTDLAGHPLNVVHRDVSPENLMMTFEGRIKVLDFGIALMRGRQAPVTEYGTVKGKPPYLSPEQIKNQPLDRRSDVFSAAVVLHELLTGETVFTGDSVYAVARAVEHAEVLPPSASVGALPEGLDEVVMHGLARDLDERWQTALAMAEALDRVAAGVGGESLESWAARELAGAREEHRTWLAEVLGHGSTSRGRASGVVTAQAPAVVEPVVETPFVDEGPRRRRGLMIAGLILLLAAMAAGIVYMTRTGTPLPALPPPGGGEDATAAIVDAGVTDAAVVVTVEVPVDAGTRKNPKPRTPPPLHPSTPPPPTPVPTPPPDASVQLAPGYLTVAAEPFAQVRIDGEDVGNTPIFKRELSAGRHTVELITPDTNVVRLKRTITIQPGKLESIIVK
jgi:serine/threonine-protein kinase